ncbi:hypothetical protein GGR53DRAFT_466544 [Hypoxylon sp. FL1150]|nr:hypothetical protein GGR53DRAFT_466544 [Hypoxylon sp. FL1150]
MSNESTPKPVGSPVKEPIFGPPDMYDPKPGLSTIIVNGKPLGFNKSLLIAESSAFARAFEEYGTEEDEITIEHELVNWTTVSSYLHILNVDRATPIIFDEYQREKTFDTIERFKKLLGYPLRPVVMDVTQLKILYLVQFHGHFSVEERLRKLEIVSMCQQNTSFSTSMPMHDFYELAKLFHFCYLVDSPALAFKVEHVFLRYLECMTMQLDTEDDRNRLQRSSNEWFMLGNARIAHSIVFDYWRHVLEGEDQNFIEELKSLSASK